MLFCAWILAITLCQVAWTLQPLIITQHSRQLLVLRGSSPQIRNPSYPLPTSFRVFAILDALDNITASLLVTLVEPLLELDPARILSRPVGAPTVVVLEVVEPPLAICCCIELLVPISAWPVLAGFRATCSVSVAQFSAPAALT